MFSKILIANRGEIALRVIRACQELGVATVAVYSEADVDALHVRFADEAICIGPGPAHLSYLDYRRIIAAAEIAGADAVHPGYGFLAENAEFAEVCVANGLAFIGPPAEAISKMGDKAYAKSSMRAAGVPVTPGSEGAVLSLDAARAAAEEVGYPVILKASAGGGGRGMRVVRSPDALETSYELARAEAEAAFSNPELYLERYILRPRHIEIQLMADTHGNIVFYGERDCSIQRRHQKLIEESPSTAVSEELRAKLGEAAVSGARAAGYVGAGTMEFLLDEDGSFYFMEMNTRVQVEHPVTEQITGVDIIKEQIRIAAGRPMKHSDQETIEMRGHAIEFRINAEDPEHNFRPSPGTISVFNPPGGFGVRVDSHVYSGYKVPPYYDSLLAKLIVWGETRAEAVARARRALDEFIVVGIPTTIEFHQKVVENEAYIAGDVYTDFVERHMS